MRKKTLTTLHLTHRYVKYGMLNVPETTLCLVCLRWLSNHTVQCINLVYLGIRGLNTIYNCKTINNHYYLKKLKVFNLLIIHTLTK